MNNYCRAIVKAHQPRVTPYDVAHPGSGTCFWKGEYYFGLQLLLKVLTVRIEADINEVESVFNKYLISTHGNR